MKLIIPLLMPFFLCPTHAKTTLSSADVKFKSEHIKQINTPNLLTPEGAQIWDQAIGIATRSEDSELMQALLNAPKNSDGAEAELFATFFYKAYAANPIFYLKEALKNKKNKMDDVAATFVNEVEMTEGLIKKLEDPLKSITSLDPDFGIAQQFLNSCRKIAENFEKERQQRIASVCKKQIFKTKKRVDVEGKLVCTKTNVSMIVQEGCLELPNHQKIILDSVVQIRNWQDVALRHCNRKKILRGEFTVPDKDHAVEFLLSEEFSK